MIEKPLPTRFLLHAGRLTWDEAWWGVEHGWAEPALFTELATQWLAKDLEAPKNVVLLAGLSKDDIYDTLALASELRAQIGPKVRRPDLIWMYLALRWVFEHRGNFLQPLAEVEEIYADFGYPREIEHLVRFMPPTDGYDPSAHTAAENESRIYDDWATYLEQQQEGFRSRGEIPHHPL